MFTGLSAFPLTPLDETGADRRAGVRAPRVAPRRARAWTRSARSAAPAATPISSRAERARAARLAVGAADGVPVMIGIGAVRTEHVIEHAHDAQEAGAAAVMLAPVSYQALTEDEVYGLYADVTAELSVPLCVYDNPGTTHFAFSDDLHAQRGGAPRRAARSSCPGAGAAERIGALAAARPDERRDRRQRRSVRRRRAERRRGRLVQRDRRAVPGGRARDRARARGRVGAARAAVGAVPPPRRRARGRDRGGAARAGRRAQPPAPAAPARR